MISAEVEMKPLASEAELLAEIEACTDRVEGERLHRRLHLRRSLGEGETHTVPLWVWRFGDAAFVAVPEEPYSVLQEELRRRFPGIPLFVLCITNGAIGYLCPREAYGENRYQEVQSPYAAGCLEVTIEALADGVASLFGEK
jgi:hypothetical protein